MIQQASDNWVVLVAVLVVVFLLASWLIARARKPAKRSYKPDVLDEGMAPAQRNQALIDSAPVSQAEAVVAAPVISAAPSSGDDLTRIKGLGPKLKALLEGLGITTFAQIAAWSEEDIVRIDSQLGSFAGRPARDNWVEQARFLAAGDSAGFAEKFGKV
jgi:predicted flap endonuclease-1-like 5' DNA nuclease